MTESILPWWYTHPYNLDSEINYAFTFEPNNSNYIYAFKEAFIPSREGGWGGGVNLSWVTVAISNIWKLVKDENEKMKDLIKEENVNTKKHIDFVKNDIVNSIDEIDTNVDLSGVNEWIGILKQRFTVLQKWLKEEQRKEMEEKDKENEWKMSELQKKIDEIEEVFDEMQNLSKAEVEEKKKLIDEMEETAQEIMEELEKEKNTAKEIAKKDIISSLSE